jgi:hypothetical protein
MADERIRIELAFEGGHVVSALIDSDSVDRLERALGGGGGDTVLISADDGTYTVALQKVVYLKRFARENRVGFGAG